MTEYDDVIVEHKGKTWETDYEGYLLYVSPLDIKTEEDWYDYIRMKDGIPELNSEHIEVLEYYQYFYRKNGIAPPLYVVARGLQKPKDSILKLFFPSKNPLKTIHIMAGLPRPTGHEDYGM